MSGWKHAFSLPANAVKKAIPPGTVILIEHDSEKLAGKQGDSVVKVPTPTADPADPLNWSRWRKVTCMLSVAYYVFVANYISSSLAPALPLWNHVFPHDQRPMQDLIQLVSFNVLAVGLGNIFWVPLSNIYGRRLVLNLSVTVLGSSCGIGMMFTGYKTTMIMRLLQGLGSSASETVSAAVVGDLFFVHERGGWMAFYSASLASGSVIGGITGGYVAAKFGWVKQFWLASGLAAISCLTLALLVPETMYDRNTEPLLPTHLHRHREPPLQRLRPRTRTKRPPLRPTRARVPHFDLTNTIYAPIHTNPQQLHTIVPLPPPRYAPYTFRRSLRFSPYRGHVAHHFLKPWTTLRLPATWIVMFQYGGLVGCAAVISTVGPQLLAAPPYRWGEHAGLLFVGALVGIVLGGMYTALVADRQLKAGARRNADTGYAEPEARVWIMLPALVVGTCGLAVFGGCAHAPATVSS
ncbi:hypothetical protein CHGG_07613 [Chaetomium globosum CBS 148.51]|uniref:Major facilitator superfamily (MFS) profile domain-containing protein n=1 Tax=Chaetomium globosum (strain ATCC 6205 / CBS 148.51 / DSM 1962 / NBRC 6347 / NRRL 1970) TaxID=306901 RepID=Q2GWP1_CHAGB|nr:uncharacterized protein CHGG_07613 [Chaetomium globosum CBS 148.51]EAQ86360.1 hypothetical protein CHGG_07613 [Chaetomium globosum CBS 148.51]